MLASEGGHEGALGLLIAAGADVNLQSEVVDRWAMCMDTSACLRLSLMLCVGWKYGCDVGQRGGA